MHDMNFFSAYRSKQSKGSYLGVFLVILLAVVVVLNGAMIFGATLVFKQLNSEISELQAYMNNPKTQEQIALANKTREQADISGRYLSLIESASLKLDQLNQTNTELFDLIVRLTPDTTKYTFFEINGSQIMLECRSTIIEDPLDMYHALENEAAFSTIALSGISQTDDGSVIFSFICQLAGGNPS